MQWIVVIIVGLIAGIYSLYLYRNYKNPFKITDNLKCFTKQRITGKDLIQLLLITVLSIYAKLVFGFPSLTYSGYLLFAGMLCLLSRVDLEERIVPDSILIRWGIFIAIYIAAVGEMSFFLNRLIGALAVGLITGGFYLLRRDSIGLGDIKLLMVCGLMKGFPGIISYLFRCLILGLIYAVIILVRKKGDMKTEIPFVPFLFLGALL